MKKILNLESLIRETEISLRCNPTGEYGKVAKLKLRILLELTEYFGEEEANLIASLLMFWRYPMKHKELGETILRILEEENET